VVNCEDSQRIDQPYFQAADLGKWGKPPRQFKPKVQHSGEEACS